MGHPTETLLKIKPCEISFFVTYVSVAQSFLKPLYNWDGCYGRTRLLAIWMKTSLALHRRHNERDCVSDHQPHDCLLNCLFKRRSRKTSKLRVTGFRVGISPMTGEFPAQRASKAENVSIWWRHHGGQQPLAFREGVVHRLRQNLPTSWLH